MKLEKVKPFNQLSQMHLDNQSLLKRKAGLENGLIKLLAQTPQNYPNHQKIN